jgi:hypothetical protein
MLVEQISVFLENRSGSLVEVISVLGDEGIKILSTFVTSKTEYGVLYMIVDQPERAQEALRDQGFSCRISDVAVIQLDDNDGIVPVLKRLSDGKFNVEYLYTFSQQPSGSTWMAFRCDDIEKAVETIQDLPGVRTQVKAD